MTAARWLIAASLLAGTAAADSSTLRGPVSGYILDARSRELRPVNGIPGGATLGAPLRLSFGINLAAVSAERDYAVVTAFRRSSVPVLIKGLAAGEPQVISIPGAIPATSLDLSDDGTSVIVSSTSAAKIQLIRGLPDNPDVFAAADVSDWAGGISAVAVDPAGTRVVGAAGDGSIYLFTVQGSSLGAPQWLGRVPGASSVTFVGSDTAAAGSATSGDVILFRGLGGSVTMMRAAGAGDGIQSVVAMHWAGAQNICVAEGTSGKAAVIDASAADSVQWFAPAGPANRCDRLSQSILVLNQAGRQPLLLLDASGRPAVYFVPVN